MRQWLELWHPGRDLPITNRRVYGLITHALRTMLRLSPFRRQPWLVVDGSRWHVWQASGYLSVNRRQAQYIVRYLHDRHVTEYFRHCFVPEELTIPTIIYNSPWRHEAQVYRHRAYHGIASLAATHYFHYGSQVKTLTDDDLPTLTTTDRMFCRKVVTGASDSLVAAIDRQRQQTPTP